MAAAMTKRVGTTEYRGATIEVWYCEGNERPWVARGWYALVYDADGQLVGRTKTLQSYGHAEGQGKGLVDDWAARGGTPPTAPTRRFRVRGTTDDVTTCDCCGRQNLKVTVMLEVLDADGNGTGQIYYLGRDCAAKASGWTQREVKRLAREADDEAERQRRWEADQRERAECERWHGWLREQTGCTEIMDAILALGGFAAARAQYKAWLSQQA